MSTATTCENARAEESQCDGPGPHSGAALQVTVTVAPGRRRHPHSAMRWLIWIFVLFCFTIRIESFSSVGRIFLPQKHQRNRFHTGNKCKCCEGENSGEVAKKNANELPHIMEGVTKTKRSDFDLALLKLGSSRKRFLMLNASALVQSCHFW